MTRLLLIDTWRPARYALIKRVEKLLKEIDDYFDDANEFGLSVEQADPRGDLTKIRIGLISTLVREGRIKVTPAKDAG